ncbi:Rhomboid protease GluP [Nocardioides dokdonensis FR1436]|uniref:Rhomboid protease GluP n=1 Tax=Nocardioides dokdonensis FR1436 TaxID=1300347 RepID=A0A1A9GJE1_9ACTN|nr:Rhomboid protease GluP [Nocardioides dokdonensis FR1436]
MPVCYRHPGRETYIRCQRCDRPICPDCMRDASVGFQCPECVAEGARSTRQNRTAYGGLRPTDASRTSMVLIALNVAVWIAISVTGGAASRLVDLLALRTNGVCLTGEGGFDVARAVCEGNGTWLPGFVDGAFWQVLSSGFTHVQLMHLGFNMLALYLIGPQLEAVLGRARFLALYLISLLAGSVVVLWAASQYGATVGASGAIYGLFAALLVVARKVGGDMRQLLILVAINVVITFAVPNISWQGHLGGFVGGAVVTALLVHAPRGPRRGAFQVVGLVLLTLSLLAAAVLRIAALS